MTDSDYNLEKAVKFAARAGRVKSYLSLSMVELPKALKTLAYANDEINFRKIVDNYVKLVRKTKKEFKKDPLNFLEWVCMGMDNGFTTSAFYNQQGKMPEEGQTQKLFRRLYGQHYFIEGIENSPN